MKPFSWLLVGVGVVGAGLVLFSDDEAPPIGPVMGMDDWIEPAKRLAPEYGLKPALPLSFIEHESNGSMSAVRFECHSKEKGNFGSKTGCPIGTQRLDKKGRPIVSRGPFQFLIGTAEQYGLPEERHEELHTNPELALEIGLKMLADLKERYNGELYYMAAAYNGGPKGADKAFRRGSNVSNHDYAILAQKLFDKWQQRLT